MKYHIEKISTKRSMKDFNKLPYLVYRDDPDWIPPLLDVVNNILDPATNPYFNMADLDLYLCYKGKVPVCRAISVINTSHWVKFGEKTAFFGFFESIQDQEGCNILFDYMAEQCSLKGASFIEGPFNPNHYSELGVQIPPYSTPPVFFETYNPPFYSGLIQNAGFKESYRVHTRINRRIDKYVKEREEYFSKPLRSGEFTLRKANLCHISSDLGKIREVYNDAFEDNWHFLPVTQAEYHFSARYLFFLTYPSLVIFVEKGDETVGVLQCMLNINPLVKRYNGRLRWIDYPDYLIRRNSIDEIVLYAVGIKKRYQGTAVVQLLVEALVKICTQYKVLSTTWMSDDNKKAIKHAEYFGLKPYKWFSIYKRSL